MRGPLSKGFSSCMVSFRTEAAFRSTLVGQWCEEHGVELLPCAAEAHGHIGIVECSIKIRRQFKSSSGALM